MISFTLERTADGSLRRWRPGGAPHLVCLPPAGGSAASFLALASSLRADWAVTAVDPPGHGACPGMPLTSVGALAAAVTRVLLPVREPVFLLGHSLGGMVALRLARAGQLTVRGLILCGVPSPQRIAGVQVAADVGASDEELLGELARLGGVPPAVMKSVEFARHFLPPLRADLAAYAAEADDWARGCFAGLPRVRVLVVTGDADPLAPPDCLRDWVGFAGRVTAGLVPGGHFFPQQNAPALAGLLDSFAASGWPDSGD